MINGEAGRHRRFSTGSEVCNYADHVPQGFGSAPPKARTLVKDAIIMMFEIAAPTELSASILKNSKALPSVGSDAGGPPWKFTVPPVDCGSLPSRN